MLQTYKISLEVCLRLQKEILNKNPSVSLKLAEYLKFFTPDFLCVCVRLIDNFETLWEIGTEMIPVYCFDKFLENSPPDHNFRIVDSILA